MDRRQLIVRIVMVIVVALAIFAGWRGSQNASPNAEMKAARAEALAEREAAEAARGE